MGISDLSKKTAELTFRERRGFGAVVRRDMAERVARKAAALAAYEAASRLLAREPDVHFIADAAGTVDAISLDGLAHILFGIRLVALGAEGNPPSLFAVAEVSLEAPASFRESLVKALSDEDALELHGRILARERELVARYDELAPSLLSLSGLHEGGKEQFYVLQSIVNELAGLELFSRYVTGGELAYADPDAVKARLQRAERLAPNNPLILNALAEYWLYADRPLVALDYSGRAVAGAPKYARAHDTHGAIFLRQRLPLMASRSFSKAIEFAPRNASYYMNRASAYLLLEETEAMCRDFQRACALGECEGLFWASEERRCNKDTQ